MKFPIVDEQRRVRAYFRKSARGQWVYEREYADRETAERILSSMTRAGHLPSSWLWLICDVRVTTIVDNPTPFAPTPPDA